MSGFGPCNCESSECGHDYLKVSAGESVSMFIGPICDRCADTHMKPYLLTGDEAKQVRQEYVDMWEGSDAQVYAHERDYPITD